ncbi:unnamed protein product [Tenebrio molitor]|nr:unnamed protein product [Tenebrio molitor]
MATTPCTIVVFTEDKLHFPIKMAKVVIKQLFQYGVKEIREKNDKIFISLSYSPKGLTLKKKFGNLPVRYMRTKLDNEDEFKMLEKVVKRYKFNLVDEDLEEMHRLQTTTKKLYLEEPSQMSGEDDDDSETQNLNGAASPDGQVFM